MLFKKRKLKKLFVSKSENLKSLVNIIIEGICDEKLNDLNSNFSNYKKMSSFDVEKILLDELLLELQSDIESE